MLSSLELARVLYFFFVVANVSKTDETESDAQVTRNVEQPGSCTESKALYRKFDTVGESLLSRGYEGRASLCQHVLVLWS